MARHVLRPYQVEAVQAHFDFFETNPTGNALFVLPTASGKSICLAEFVRRSLKAWPSTRFLMVTHVAELVQQNYDEFIGHWDEPLHPAGIYSAGIGRRDTDCKVLFAGIQSIYNKAEKLGHFDVVLVDEVHAIPRRGTGRYRTYLESLRKINPAVRVCGYTATPFRMDGGYLHRGPNSLFSAIAYEVKVEMLIEQGYLAPLIAKQPKNVIDVAGVKTVSGDFKKDDLEKAAMTGDMVELAITETVEMAAEHDRHHWLVFATGIDHAEAIMDQLAAHGIEAESVFGSTPKDERAATIAKFKAGKLTALVNVGVLTTGFNAPCCDLIALLRPTQSTGLYIQILGRGTRTFPGKENCLLIDFGLNVARHGPINKVRIRDKSEGPAPVKTCPDCDSIVFAGISECPECGHIWPAKPRETKHDVTASTLMPFDPDAHKPRTLVVKSMFFRRHRKEGKPDSLRVDFMCGMRTYSEWVCLEHGRMKKRAGRWWRQYGGEMPVPETVGDALSREHEIKVPLKIEVVDDGDYERIRRPFYEEQEA